MLNRSERCRRDVLDAAADLVAEVGVERLTIDEVAVRSGVAKTTIYRHWPSKQELIVEAVHGCLAAPVTPNTGRLRDDLVQCFEGMIQTDLDGRVGKMYPSLLDAAQRDPHLAELVQRYQRDRRQPVVTAVQLAQARGELDADVDPELAATVLIGPLKYQKVVLQRPVTRALIESVVDTVLAGLGHPAAVADSR
jgi:AcrR family transcriptional regulator